MITATIPLPTIYATVQYSDWAWWVIEHVLRQALEVAEGPSDFLTVGDQ